MNLEEFNKLCDDFLKEYYIGVPFEEYDVSSKYTIMILYDLVLAVKEFSNSEKGISDIGKIHKVCRDLFRYQLNKHVYTTDGKMLSKIFRIVFEFSTIEIPSVYAVLKPNNTIYSMTNPMLWNDENDSKKSTANSILSVLDMFESYILAKYVDMGGDVVIGKEEMIKLSVMEEIETNIDDIIDSCKDYINYTKHSIKDIERKLSSNNNESVSLNEELIEYRKSLDMYSNMLDSTYKLYPGHDAVIAICFWVIGNDIDDLDYEYAKSLLSKLMNNNTHGISELYFRDKVYLSSLYGIGEYIFSLRESYGIDIDDMIKYSLDETVKIIKNNHGVDDIDMDKAEIVMNIYNRIYNILAYFNKYNE